MSDTHDDWCERIEVDIGVGVQVSPCHCDYRRLERENEELRKDAAIGRSRTVSGWLRGHEFIGTPEKSRPSDVVLFTLDLGNAAIDNAMDEGRENDR